jgi:hypothetical protein
MAKNLLAQTTLRQFIAVAFNAIPFAIFDNSPGALGYPATTWEARDRYQPRGDAIVMAGVYNADHAG